jgi:hypothetical protein
VKGGDRRKEKREGRGEEWRRKSRKQGNGKREERD